MKKHFKTVFILLFFIVLLSPVRVNALSPIELYPYGVVVEISPCDEYATDNRDYVVDVVVRKEELPHYEEEPLYHTEVPIEVYNSEYADIDNEWISLLLYFGNTEWENGRCESVMFGYYYHVETFEFTEFKVVVYEDGEEPVESKEYFSRNLASYDDPTGYKIIYNPIEKTFSLEGYELEYPDRTGYLDPLMMVLIGFIAVLVFVVGLFESIIYVMTRQGKKAVLIALAFNLAITGVVVLQIFEFQFLGLIEDFTDITMQQFMLFGLWVIASLYISKVVLLSKYLYTDYKVSAFISGLLYVAYVIIILSML